MQLERDGWRGLGEGWDWRRDETIRHSWWNKVALGRFTALKGFEVAFGFGLRTRTLGFDLECDGFARAPPRSK